MHGSELYAGRPLRRPTLARTAQRGLVGLLAALSLLGGAQAQPAANRDQEQLRRLRQQLQQLQQEQAGAQQQAQRAATENAQLAAQLKAQQAAAEKVQARTGAQSRTLTALQAELAAMKGERDALQAELVQAKATQTQTLARLERSNSERDDTRTRLSALEATEAGLRRERGLVGHQLDKCSAQNVELLRVGQELLGRHGNFGFGDSVALSEPFLQLKRVQLENLAQDYRGRLHEQRFVPAPSTPPSVR